MLLSLNVFSQSSVYNIVDFGAKADGITINTIAINQAIEKCNKNEGGSVIIPAGHFVSNSFLLPAPANKKLSAIQLSNGTKPVIFNCSTAKGIQLIENAVK